METGYAWAAGFYEGEGSIAPARFPKGDTTIRIQVRQSSHDENPPEVLENWRRIMGRGNIYGPAYAKNGRGRPSYSLNVTGFPAVREVLIKMWPYMGHIKRQQAMDAFRKCGKTLVILPEE